MGTILDSVKAMSEKLGVTEEAQTIADQIDLNTESITGTNPQSRDIAEAVESFNEAMPEPTPTYILLTEEPSDWSTNYTTYYTESSGDYIPVAGVDSYTLTTEEPADWATNYTDYFTESGGEYTPVTGESAPTWAANTYYSYAGKVAPTFATNTYYRKDMWQ